MRRGVVQVLLLMGVLASLSFGLVSPAVAGCSSSCPYGLSSMSNGDIYTVAGDGTSGYSGDGGPGAGAELRTPSGVAVDGDGDLLIADYANDRVRLVAAASCSSGCLYGLSSMTKGDIYTVAGDGAAGYSGDGGPASNAELGYGPSAVALDGEGDLLIIDKTNDRVRLVAAASCSSGCPYGLLSMTKGDIYTVAGDGSFGFSGDGGPATSAEFDYPASVSVDHEGDLLIADEDNNRVRLVAAASCSNSCLYGLSSMTGGDIYTIAGGGSQFAAGNGAPATSGSVGGPSWVAVDPEGDLLIAEFGVDEVRLVAATTCSGGCAYGLPSMIEGDIYTVAGSQGQGYSGDGGPATTAELNTPAGVAVDAEGNLLIADEFNNRVRLVAAAGCSSGCPYGLSSMTEGDIYTVAGNPGQGYSGDGGPAANAELYDPAGVAVDAEGDLLIADSGDDRIRVVSGGPTTAASALSVLSVSLAGSGSGFVSDGGFNCPATCTSRWTQGSEATLSATPSSGASSFVGWSGGSCSGNGACVVNMSGAESVTATFASSVPARSSSPTSLELLQALLKIRAPSGPRATPKAILKAAGYRVSFTAPVAGRLAIDWYTKTKRKQVLIARALATFSNVRTARVMLKLTVAGRKLLKRSERMKIAATEEFVPTGTAPVLLRKTFTLKA